jgi:hypothetical protein
MTRQRLASHLHVTKKGGIFNNIGLPPGLFEDVTEVIAKEAHRLLGTEGINAFDMPRSAAVAHETGHAIVGTAVGLTIVNVEIFQRTTSFGKNWCGRNDEASSWSFGDATPTTTVLARAKYLVAGVAAEQIFDPENFRHGSSIDEIVICQAICDGVFQTRRSEFPDIAHPRELWSWCWRETCSTLIKHQDAVRALMAKLDRTECLRGKPLAATLRRVRS